MYGPKYPRNITRLKMELRSHDHPYISEKTTNAENKNSSAGYETPSFSAGATMEGEYHRRVLLLQRHQTISYKPHKAKRGGICAKKNK